MTIDLQHVLADLEPKDREPIELFIGRLLAVLSVQTNAVMMQGEQIRVLRENQAMWQEHVVRVLAYERSAQ